MVAEMVILDVEVLCTWAHFGDLRHRQRSTVVLKDFAMDFRRSHHVRDAMTLGFPEQLHQRDDLPQSSGQSDVLLRAVSVCNLDCQMMGHPAYLMTKPERDFEVLASPSAMSGFHMLRKSGST